MAYRRLIAEAFGEDAELEKRVHSALRDDPTNAPLYIEIAKYICHLESHRTAVAIRGRDVTEPSPKKRKLEIGNELIEEGSLPEHEIEVIFQARDLSFSMPMRKKLHLEVTQESLPKSGNLLPIYQIRARNPASGDLEYKVGTQSFKYALRLPVPEKAQKQSNFVLIPEFGLGIGDKSPTNGTSSQEPLLWAVNDGPQKAVTFNGDDPQKTKPAQDGGLIEETINKCLNSTLAGRLIRPDEAEFVSATPEAHRKGEKAYHVKAFRGSKDGYLYFLAAGIFFGFKKPLAFFPFEAINSVSYTSVLQRTFNLNVAVQLPDQQEIKEHEFSMLDQADFAGIDAYIKRHELQDASLAESRKAKKVNLNGLKRAADEDGVEEVEPQSELQKAQQDVEDAEDEEEEDYDPGSEGLSEGSGESSEEEEEDEVDEAEVDEAEEGDEESAAEECGAEAAAAVPDPGDDDQL